MKWVVGGIFMILGVFALCLLVTLALMLLFSPVT